jgi:hypothetical protein
MIVLDMLVLMLRAVLVVLVADLMTCSAIFLALSLERELNRDVDHVRAEIFVMT